MDDREQGQLGEVLKIRVQASTFQLRPELWSKPIFPEFAP